MSTWEGDSLPDAIGRELEAKGFTPFGLGVPYVATDVARLWFGEQIDRLASLTDRQADRIARVEEQALALDELATPEVTASADMRAAFALAARSIRAALDGDHA
jgi:hypothetical protein